MVRYFQQAEGFILPGMEDFGITGVEALAAGTPVIAYQGGGSIDYIESGQNGVFFTEQSVDSLVKVLAGFKANKSAQEISQTAEQFSPENFKSSFKALIDKY